MNTEDLLKLAKEYAHKAVMEGQIEFPSRARRPNLNNKSMQLSIYLAAVVAEISYTDVSKFFARDRSTIMQHISTIEDLRDCVKFDRALERIEEEYARNVPKKTLKMTGIHKVPTKNKTYYYAWRGGPRLDGEPGSQEFVNSYRLAKGISNETA